MSGHGKDALLINKIMAGILTAGLVFWVANRVAAVVVPDEAPKVAAIPITGLRTAAVAAPAAAVDIDTLFAGADVAKGQAFVEQQCSACHSFGKGGAAGLGPNLYGIVGARMFSRAGFTYSGAVASKAGGVWTPDALGAWLLDPNGFAAGTAMSYAGIKKDQTRADVIAYLNRNSDKPVKLHGAK